MRAYFIRHARARSRGATEGDAHRPLSAEGRDEAGRLARALVRLEIGCDTVFSSPLLRARQTADLLQEGGFGARVDEAGELSTDGDFADLLPRLAAWRDVGRGDLALVGHLPGLALWAERLVWGEGRGCLHLPTAGMIGLELPEHGRLVGGCVLFWMTSPRLLP